MDDRTYNGWTNRATWLINVWFNPESRSDVQAARAAFEEACDSPQIPDFLRDFIDTDINWGELESQFDEETEAVDE